MNKLSSTLCLILSTLVARTISKPCEFEMHIYKNGLGCKLNLAPSYVSTVFVDGRCHLIDAAEGPRYYKASCENKNLVFNVSDCTSDTCDVCPEDENSLSARYAQQDGGFTIREADNVSECFDFWSGIIRLTQFRFFGECSDSCGAAESMTAKPTVSPMTRDPTVLLMTAEPTPVTRTPEPATDEPTFVATTRQPTQIPSKIRTGKGTNEPTTLDPINLSTISPTPFRTETAHGTTSPSTEKLNSASLNPTPLVSEFSNGTASPSKRNTPKPPVPELELRRSLTWDGLSMELIGSTSPINESAESIFVKEYKNHVEQFFYKYEDIKDVMTSILVKDQISTFSRRQLETNQFLQKKLVLVYTQWAEFSAPSNIPDDYIILAPFARPDLRKSFSDKLKSTGMDAFKTLDTISGVIMSNPAGNKSDNDNIIIVVVICICSIVVLCIGYCLWNRHKKESAPVADKECLAVGEVVHTKSDQNILKENELTDSPAEPTVQFPGAENVSVKDLSVAYLYEDETVATADYDYSKVYPVR